MEKEKKNTNKMDVAENKENSEIKEVLQENQENNNEFGNDDGNINVKDNEENKEPNIYEIKEEEDDYDSDKDANSVLIFDSEIHFLKNVDAVDIVLLIDTTCSMNPYIKSVKHFLRKLIWDARKTLSHFENDSTSLLQVGIVLYKDHDKGNKSYISKVLLDLTSDIQKFKNLIMKITCSGGEDEPEAVLDGLDTAINQISWREKSLKFIYHVLDAPPHGKNFNKGLKDNFNECPCKLKHEDVLYDLRGKGIEYSIVKIGNNLNRMIEEFSKIAKFEIITPLLEVDTTKSNNQVNFGN